VRCVRYKVLGRDRLWDKGEDEPSAWDSLMQSKRLLTYRITRLYSHRSIQRSDQIGTKVGTRRHPAKTYQTKVMFDPDLSCLFDDLDTMFDSARRGNQTVSNRLPSDIPHHQMQGQVTSGDAPIQAANPAAAIEHATPTSAMQPPSAAEIVAPAEKDEMSLSAWIDRGLGLMQRWS
jgi:hypothetical protein